MSKTKAVVSCIAGGVTTLILCFSLNVHPPVPAQAQAGGARWEYLYVPGPNPVEPPTADQLNQAGKKGWEAVAPLTNNVILMKRRL